MTVLNCEQIEDQLELFLLDEVREPERSAVLAHLARCGECSQSLEEANRLLGLLDLKFNEADRLARLRERLEPEVRPRLLPFQMPRVTRQLASLAALLLLAVIFAGYAASSARRTSSPPGMVAKTVRMTPGSEMRIGRGAKIEFGDPLVLSGGAVVQAATDAEWQRLPGNQVFLKSGTLHVRVGPVGVQPLAVLTPTGRVTALSADFTVTVEPGSVMSVQANSGSVRLFKFR